MLWLGLDLGIQGDWIQGDWNNKLLINPWKLLSTPESSYLPLKAPIHPWKLLYIYPWKLLSTPESSFLPQKAPVYPWKLQFTPKSAHLPLRAPKDPKQPESS